MDKISYAMAAQADAKAAQADAMAAQADAKADEALALVKSLTTSLATANQTIQSLTTELTDLKAKYNNVKIQLDSTTPFDQNILKDYAKKVQKIDTDTVFIDANTGSHFKMYVTNNVIAIEDITPVSNN